MHLCGCCLAKSFVLICQWYLKQVRAVSTFSAASPDLFPAPLPIKQKQQRLSSQSSLQCNNSLREDFSSGWPWEEEIFWWNIQDEDTQHLADASNQKGLGVTLPSSQCWQVLWFCSAQPNNLCLAKEYLLKHYPLWVWKISRDEESAICLHSLFYYLTFRDVA